MWKSFQPSLAYIASGKPCTTPWSVMAMARWPQRWASFARSAEPFMPSMVDMLECRCSSTRLTGASSVLSNFCTSITASGRMVTSCSYLS